VLRTVGAQSSTYYARKKRAISGHPASCDTVVSSGRPVSGHAFTQTGKRVSDEQIKEWLMELIAGEAFIYGYKMLSQCLRDEYQLVINHKKVYRLCKEMDILQPQRVKSTHHPRTLARNHTITGPNQLWQLDIKYGYVAGRDQFFYIADMIDVFDRNIVGYYTGSSCQAPAICRMVEQALAERVTDSNKPPIIRTDNGPQFISKAFGDLCEQEELVHERIPPKTPNMNAYIESFHARLESDLLRRLAFETFDEAFEAVERYMDFYNNRRLHGSLKRRSPLAFLRAITDGTMNAAEFVVAV
jgi:putative transposase